MIELDIIETSDRISYYKKGTSVWHRENGPVCIDKFRYHIEYCINDDVHRLDGPAVIKEYYIEYYINMLYYTEDDYFKRIAK